MSTRLLIRLAVLVIVPIPGIAHPFLDGTMPPTGSTVASLPPELVLHFTESVEPAFSRIEVQDQAGTRADAGAIRTQPNDATRLVVTLKGGRPGSYTVRWRVTGTDTHRTQGMFHFTLKP